MILSQKRLLKLMMSHEDMHKLLGLPSDVRITSMHTTRGEEETGIYMECERFPEVPEGGLTPIATMEQIINYGLWDNDENI